MYVNRAIAVGFDGALGEGDWRVFEERCDAVGVAPAFEVSPATAAAVPMQLAARGYEIESSRAALFCGLDVADSLAAPNPEFVIEPASGDLLALWQTTSAAGWGHETPAARRASDAFARAAAVVDGDNLVVVSDSRDGRPVGCASMTVSGRIATLGGMSTLPSERRRGVQAALILHRLRTAAALGCDLATSSAEPGSNSERNLVRHGFERRFLVETHVRHPTATAIR